MDEGIYKIIVINEDSESYTFELPQELSNKIPDGARFITFKFIHEGDFNAR